MLDIQPVSILSIGIPAGREGALARGGHPPVVLLVLLLCLLGEGRYAIRQIEEPPLQCAVPETETGVGSPDQSDR